LSLDGTGSDNELGGAPTSDDGELLPASLSVSALLAHALVAFTIEFDNEAEHRIAHRVTRGGGSRGAPWLVSQVMWVNTLQYLDRDRDRDLDRGAEWLSEGALCDLARTSRLSLTGLERWRYIEWEPDPADERAVRVRLTAAGRRAAQIWRPLAGEIEERWRDRFGEATVDELRASLSAVRDRFDPDLPLPRYLPTVYPTQNGRAEIPQRRTEVGSEKRGDPGEGSSPDLSVLLAQVLLQFTLDFERASRISLAISANTLRVLTEDGVRIRDLPVLTGVSKEANAMAVGFLVRRDCAVERADPAATRGKIVCLTSKGVRALAKYRRLLDQTQTLWEEKFGADALRRLQDSLVRLVGARALVRQGMEPYPDGWRASVRRPATLPHYPMVLHRGGYPDGS
jgi:DNA-binding MarR family transcriptional regulator